jgi:hypothetical protein
MKKFVSLQNPIIIAPIQWVAFFMTRPEARDFKQQVKEMIDSLLTYLVEL